MSRASYWKLTSRQRRRFQQQLKQCSDVRQYRRLLALLEVDRGEPVAHVAKRLGVTRQSVHHWMHACQGLAAGAAADALEDQPRSGRPSVWDEGMRELLDQWLAESPEEHGYAVASWTVPLLAEQFRHARDQAVSEHTLRRELHRRGYTWKRSRYVLEPDPEREKKTKHFAAFSTAWAAERDPGGR